MSRSRKQRERKLRWFLRWHGYEPDRRKAFAIKLQEGLPKSGKRAMYGEVLKEDV